MDYKNDYEILYMIRDNDEDARDMMFEKYMPIIKNIANKCYLANREIGADFDDFVQEGLIALNQAIIKYDENKDVLFYTYASVVIAKHMFNYIRNLKVKKNTILNECSYIGNNLYNALENISYEMDENFLEEKFINLKNFFEFENSVIFELRYNGFSFKEIAILLDLSISTVQYRMNKIKKILHMKLQKQ